MSENITAVNDGSYNSSFTNNLCLPVLCDHLKKLLRGILDVKFELNGFLILFCRGIFLLISSQYHMLS